jgi:hypothetical protein
MHAPQDVSIYLNNALKPTHQMAELESDSDLPDTVREMPEDVSGHFIALDAPLAGEISAAWKRVMILNPTQVLYTFTFDPVTERFAAHKR